MSKYLIEEKPMRIKKQSFEKTNTITTVETMRTLKTRTK